MPKSVIIPAGSSAPWPPSFPARWLMAWCMSPVRWLLINIIMCCLPMTQRRKPATFRETIRKVIETAGGTMADVTFNSIFITDWKNYAAINEIYAEFFPGDKPARFCIQCGLVKPDALVEIATIAHIAK